MNKMNYLIQLAYIAHLVFVPFLCVSANSVEHASATIDFRFNDLVGDATALNLQQQQQQKLQNNIDNNSLSSKTSRGIVSSEPGFQEYYSAVVVDRLENYQTQQASQQQTEIKSLQLKINQQQQTQVPPRSERIVCNTIEEYLTAIGEKSLNETVLIHWNKTGSLLNISPRIGQPREGWLNDNVVQMLFSQTNPSENGTAALLFNSDIIRPYQWKFIPPIPVMLYTMPKDLIDPESKFILVPNPYDRDGNSERQIQSIQSYFKKANNYEGSVTFDEFSKRKNTIVWRGAIRYQKDRKLLALMSADDLINKDGWLDAVDSFGNSPSHMAVETMAERYRYQIDLGGCSGTSWNGLRWKMCASGGVVFKVDTFSVDWWHNDLIPWKHYIPVKADLSDLREKYDWAEQNLKEAYEIGQDGRNLCSQSHTEETASQLMIDIVQDLPSLHSQELNDELVHIFDQKVPKTLFNHSYS